jgi:CBS domain-containing protein
VDGTRRLDSHVTGVPPERAPHGRRSHNIAEGSMQVQDIMTRPPQTCTVDIDLGAASRRLKETGCGVLVVLDHRGRLTGIVTDRDLALAIGDLREPARIRVNRR